MTERPDDTRLHDWLDDTVGQAPDPIEGTQQVMSQLEETPQVGRWLPFPVFHRRTKAKTPTTDFTADHQPTSIPSASGHSPTVLGRTQSMFSPVKAITAGALVFAIGGVLLIGQPFGQQSASVPGAESGAAGDPAWVTARVEFGTNCDFGDITTEDGVTQERGMNCRGLTWMSDDPRLEGVANVASNADSFHVEGQSYSLVTSALEILTDAGGWQCTNADRVVSPAGLLSTTSVFDGDRLSCSGYGDNEGLSAILVAEWAATPQSPARTVEGLIFTGEMPPMPEVPTAD